MKRRRSVPFVPQRIRIILCSFSIFVVLPLQDCGAFWLSTNQVLSSQPFRTTSTNIHRKRKSSTSRQDNDNNIETEESESTTTSSVFSGMISSPANNNRSQLFSAFTNLNLSDQYDAVLVGLCAKILDATDITEQEASVQLQDCTQLLQEMNVSNIDASSRSLMALVDVRVCRSLWYHWDVKMFYILYIFPFSFFLSYDSSFRYSPLSKHKMLNSWPK